VSERGQSPQLMRGPLGGLYGGLGDMLRVTALALLLLSSVLAGCSEWGACTLSVEPGVLVEIRDAADGTPIAASASGTIIDDNFQDSLRLHDGALTRAGADERAGTYTVRVLHTGYVLWEQTGVRVRETGCHVDTVTLQADLQRAP
jgi:hypothetical protein